MTESLPVLSVSDYNQYFKTLIDYDPLLQNCRIEGEVSSFKYYKNGQQVYFTITDGISLLNCVIYNAHQKKLEHLLVIGKSITIHGKCNFFKQKGSIIFQASYAFESGLGTQQLAFEELKKRLAADGIFDLSIKKPIPPYPEKIHLITSPKSAAEADILTCFKKLTPHINVTIIPSTMQGERAPFEICSALDISASLDPDLCLISRGGGSAEDLSSFNDERIVRHIFNYPHPIITAIGHDIDTTLSDFSADCSYPTPTAAAKAISEPINNLKQTLQHRFSQSFTQLTNQLEKYKDYCVTWKQSSKRHINHQLSVQETEILHLIQRLESNNPLLRLKQGYSITRHKTKVIKTCENMSLNDTINTQLSDGTLTSVITNISKQ